MWTMRGKTLLFSLLLLALVLSACGGDDTPPAPTATPSITPTHTSIASIPTWTPVPSNTPAPPRATIDIDYARPTTTPFSGITDPTAGAAQSLTPPLTESIPLTPPTSLPTQPVTPGAPNPTVTISLQTLNTSVATALASQETLALPSTPTIQLRNGQLLVEGQDYATVDTTVPPMPVLLRVNVLQVQGKPALTVNEAVVTSDNSPYYGALTGPYLDLVEEVLAALVDAQYFAVRPGDTGYFIATITVTNAEIVFQTVSMPG